MRTYTELSQLPTIEERFDYLVLDGEVGYATFGYDRWVNQGFYRSREWKDARSFVIARDLGCDMGVPDFPVRGAPHIHHINPITMEDLEFATDALFSPDNLVCVSRKTHNAIHFGDRSQLPWVPAARAAGDTRLW
jgi:hypothetical protein